MRCVRMDSSWFSAPTNARPYSRIFRIAVMLTVVPMAVSAQGPIFDETDPRSLGSCFCNDTAAADLDGDGDLDVIHTHNCIMEAVSWNDGNGYFPTSTVVHTGGCGETGANIVLADYDHDDDLDLLFGSPNSQGTMWYRNDGQQNFTGIVPIVDVVVAAVELNGDDYIDLCARGGLIYLNDQAGGFVLSQDLAPSGSPGAPGFGDVDNDGHTDCVIDGLLWLNDGTGAFSDSGQVFSIEGSQPAYESERSLVDVDNDGHMDLVVGNYHLEVVAVYLNDGAGVFTSTGNLLQLTSGSVVDIALGDVDFDGNIDLVSSNGPGDVYLGDGQGGFSGPVQSFPPGENSPPYDVSLAYLNADSAIDIIVGAAGENTCGSPTAYMNLNPPPIPAVSEWGMIAMTLLTLTAGTLAYWRRRMGSLRKDQP